MGLTENGPPPQSSPDVTVDTVYTGPPQKGAIVTKKHKHLVIPGDSEQFSPQIRLLEPGQPQIGDFP